MAKRKSTLADQIRQGISKGIKRTNKSVVKALTAKQKAAVRERDADLLARWRALKRLGVIQTKNTPSKKHLTKRLRQKINKEFYDLQGSSIFTGKKTVRPLEKVVTKSAKTGRESTRYKLTDYYTQVKTKAKTNARSGVIKTKKGYLVQKSNPASKVRINKKGEVVESINGYKFRRSGYTGKKIAQLISDIENGKVKLRIDQMLVYRPWGSARVEQIYENDSLQDMVETFYHYQREMSPTVFEQWLNQSELLFIEHRGQTYVKTG